MEIIRSADKVLDVLGGNKAVKELFGFVPSAIANWRALGRFPPETFLVFTVELSKRGLAATPELWRMRKAANGKTRR